MYCTSCGNALGEADRYCSQCGKANAPGPGGTAPAPPPGWSRPRFERAMSNKKLAGVCGGVARYLDIDVTLVRVLFIVGVLFKLATVILYLVLWAAMSRDDQPAMGQMRTA
jgi:phage shock protein PspC (stress-responsive transcriptional regulator)